ncbi:MAG: hypothetical protein NZV14_18615 [Bryobacteraceae bacterium]|nr:hypothetical protein [Bryobacteraceae bacterium]MDW8380181.1 hypothetical protein [Bryobacterales bacterium]
MWLRRLILAGMLALASCQNEAERREVLPMTLGVHRRLNVENMPAEEYPEEYKRLGLKRARRALYQQGEAKILATVYEMASPAVAFEMVQKWRPEPGKLVFHQGPFFVVLASTPENQKPMNELAQHLEQVLKR